LAYRVSQELFYEIDAPPRVLAGKNLPGIGLHPNLEENSVPQNHEIEASIRELLEQVP
jgi:2-oxoisovalerate dehydrogenase E1 component beta subunit